MLATTITLTVESIAVILGTLGIIFGWLSKLNSKENQLIRRLDRIDNHIENSISQFESGLQKHKSENELEFYKLRSSLLMLKTHQENIEKYLQARSGYTPRSSGHTDASFLGEENDTTNHQI